MGELFNSDLKVNLFNGFMNPCGGSERETLDLYLLLRSKADVQLWATSSRASSELMHNFPIKKISFSKKDRPNGGTYIFLGAHWRNKIWPYFTPIPNRLIYVYNTFHHKTSCLISSKNILPNWPKSEIVFISKFQKKLLGLDGVVYPSPININCFIPSKHRDCERLVIGRISRDGFDKHHEGDLAVYNEFASNGCMVRIQGGTCLANKIPRNENIQLLPEGYLPAEQLLQGLDVFYYRTGKHVETFGRVVFEAMACGLPVVCHYHGGYADHIIHGKNGFLFETTEQACQILRELISNSELRARVGRNARNTVEQLFSKQALENMCDYYLK